MKLENPGTQHLLEEAAERNLGGEFKVVRRWRLFGDRAIHGDLASLAELLREHEEILRKRWGRLAILAENNEEKAQLETSYRELGYIWEVEDREGGGR